jgi:Domain of unknown function (DUF4157)
MLAHESRRLKPDKISRPQPVVSQAGHRDLTSVRDDYLAGRVPVQALAAVRQTISEPGRPLDPVVRADFESRMRHSFADVRVHSDERAGRSALALGSEAYAAGRHIVFAPACYQPQRSEGQALIQHELTHVRDQARSSPGSVRVAEAHEFGNRSAATAEPGTVQRSLFGAITGGLVAAGVGAVGGALLGSLLGPAGTVVGGILGGLIGGLAGLIRGDTASTDVRPLKSGEVTEAKKVFGDSIDYDRVRLGESAVMTAGPGQPARTPFETIYFPPGTLANLPMPWLIHELTHVWQTQHGVSVVTKIWWALHSITGNPYDYGEEAGLKEKAAQGRHFRDFNTEQQGDICKNYYMAQQAGLDTSAYDPFIQEVKGQQPRK